MDKVSRRGLLGRFIAIPATIAVAPGLAVSKVDGPYDYVWETAKHELIPLPKMEDSHLLNTERMLRGDGRRLYEEDNAAEAHIAVIKEVARRGLRTRRALPARSYDYYIDGPDDDDFS